MSDLVLKNCKLASGETVDIKIQDGKFSAIGQLGEEGVDLSGLMVFPGFVDMHTHLREPGFEASETVLTGTQSAAAGGYTAVFSMANTLPVSDSRELVEEVFDLGVKAGYADVRPIGAITKGLKGIELADITGMAQSRAEVKIFSDDGFCLTDDDLMEQAMQLAGQVGGFIAQHPQDHSLTPGAQMNEGTLATELGLTGWPAYAEERIIQRDIDLAKKHNLRIHICHLTTKGAVEIVRKAKSEGVRVSAEVTPHHLLLTEELVRSYDPVYKVNPPLRSKADTLALQDALIDGTIDVIGTDHAPHSAEKKECEWDSAAFGMVGLENAASVAQKVLIESGKSNWQRFQEVLSSTAAELTGLSSHGTIAVGTEANLAILDPQAKRTITSKTHSKSTNNPFAGLELPGEIVHTIYRGEFTYRDRKLVQR